MSSDSEIDGIERFQSARERELYEKAGLGDARSQDFDMSDEEVLGLESDNDDDGEDGQEQYYDAAAASENDDENWGDTRDNYFGGEDDLGEEGASDEEEEEALRLQRKQLAEMEDADFLDEDDLEGWKQQSNAQDLDVAEEAPALDASSMSAEERRELIETKFPIVLLLSSELGKCRDWERELAADQSLDEHLREAGKATLHTYMGMIYSFFHLFSERVKQGNMKGLSELEEHPVHEGILTARQLWQDFQKVSAARVGGEEASISGAKGDSENLSDTMYLSAKEEEAEPESRASETSDEVASEVESWGDSASDSGVSDSSSHRRAVNNVADDDEFRIEKPKAAKSKAPAQAWKVVGDFDETADTIEQQQRAKNKQSLRFYTSQIGKNDVSKASQSNGDMDVPYREREFERRQRLMQEAQKRGQAARDRLGEDDDEDEDDALNDFTKHNSQDRAEERPATAYSQMQQQRESLKEKKRREYAEAKEAARAGRVAEYLAENPNADKRALNYQIEKNKGLTPHRKKENRNARVKKRLRYEAAQKKIKGVRRVFQEPQGPYQGELTGIRKNLVHSNKFKN